ncbi:MAG: imidazolonepropionase [Defluviitaleaceae bacterium]|nr:imidazolonepropionase [Defluviitaleaceae bacterium]
MARIIDLLIKSDKIVWFDDANGDKMRIFDGYISIESGKIAELSIVRPENARTFIDATGKTVTPGLIDAHTHLIHGGSRENEMSMKLHGMSYLDILRAGGGILSTVAATRAATKDELKANARRSLDIMLSHGTTTVEAKSGYGLDFDTEVKQLECTAELNAEHPVDIISTYMGAHAMPPEYKENRRGYIDLMLNKVLPYIKERGLAEFVDIFCEDAAFSVAESREILTAAKNLGYKLKIHADEIVPIGGAVLATELGAVSAEHLLATDHTDYPRISSAGVTAVLLPATAFYLMKDYAKAREMIDAGVRVALATDFNPGSCPTENLQAVITFAAFGMKLTTEEVLRGMTINAAYAVGRQGIIGNLRQGMAADIVIWNAPNPDYLLYRFGINHVETVVKNGKITVNKPTFKL